MKNIKKMALALTVTSLILPTAANAANHVCVNAAQAVVSAQTTNVSIKYYFAFLMTDGSVVSDKARDRTTRYTDTNKTTRERAAVLQAKQTLSRSPVEGIPLCTGQKSKGGEGGSVYFSGYVIDSKGKLLLRVGNR